MQYMGGKERQAKHIVAQLQEHGSGCTGYLEPFVGGGSIFSRVAPLFPGAATGADGHLDLIMMWRAVQRGWEPPTSVSREDWYGLKDAESSALRGFVGFGCSFGGRWFEGYANNSRGDDFCGAARRGVLRKAAQMRDSSLVHADYRDLSPAPGTLVYCDPPYAGTKFFSGMPSFNHEEFWSVVRRWSSNGATVLVSEYTGPEWSEEVWSRASVQSLRKDNNKVAATEKLFKVPAYVTAA